MKKKRVKTKRPNVTTYIRPSRNAVKAACYDKAGQELIIYSSIKGWLEIRRENKDGGQTAEFICKEDITYGINFITVTFKERLIAMIKRAIFPKFLPEGL